MLDNVPISLLHSALLFGGVGQAKYLKSQTKGTPPGPTTQSFEPEDFPETAEKPAIGGLLRLRFSLRGDRFWPECDFGRSVSGPRNIVSPMQIRRW